MTEKQSLLQISPDRELMFHGPFTDVVTRNMVLTNPQNEAVCFKVKTTAPKQYCVRPNSGLLQPGDKTTVTVMLQPLDGIPSDANGHKFLVQACIAPSANLSDLESVWKMPNPPATTYNKLMVVFVEKGGGEKSVNGSGRSFIKKENQYLASNYTTDVTIKVGATDFHFNKKILTDRSKYFYDMFMSNAEADSSELIKLDDMKAEHFCYLLASFDPFFEIANISWTYEDYIELANRFGVQSLHQKCENYLIKTEECNTMGKIVLADANNYEHLMKTCIDSLKSFMEIKELQGDERFLKLKDSTRARIMRRCAEFLKKDQEDVIRIANRLKNSSLKTSNSEKSSNS